MPDVLIVDGYNILHCWPELVRIKESSFAHARDKLIAELVNYQPYWGGPVIVVFDAFQVADTVERKEKIGAVEIIYSGPGETADTAIEKMVGNMEARGQVYVATSDYLEQRMIFGKGALRIPATELKDNIEKAHREMNRIGREDLQTNSMEYYLHSDTRKALEKWLRR